ASVSENIKCLHLAHQRLSEVTKLDPSFVLAWYHDAEVLIKLGFLDENSEFFIEANEKFEKVANLLLNDSSSLEPGELYWKWGNCLSIIGLDSGEPNDYYLAVEKYRKAEKFGPQSDFFFIDY